MKVKVYFRPQNEWCIKLLAWLKKKRIKFEEYDVYESQNGKFREEVLEKTGQMIVPVTEINGEIIIGFDEKKLEAALAKL